MIQTKTAPAARRIAQNAGTLMLGRTLSQVAVAATGIIVARHLGQSGYGQYAAAYALVSSFSAMFLFGIDVIITRETARHPSAASSLLMSGFLPASSWSVVVLCAVWIAGWVFGYEIEVRMLLWFVAPSVCITSLNSLFRAACRGIQRMEVDATLDVVRGLIGVGSALGAVYLLGSAVGVVMFLLAGNLVAMSISVIVVRSILAGEWCFDKIKAASMIRASLPIGLAGVLSGLYLSLDTVFLSLTGSDSEVGAYAAAKSVAVFSLPVAVALASSMLPLLAESFGRDGRQFKEVYHNGLRYTVIIALFLGLCLSLFANPIVALLYGPEFAESAGALVILGGLVAVVFINTYFWNVLVAVDKQHLLVGVTVVNLLGMVVLGLWLIPSFGLEGAAVAVLGKELCGMALLIYHAITKAAGVDFRATTLPVLISVAGTAIGTLLIRPLSPVWFQVSVALGLGLGLLTLTGGLRRQEIVGLWCVIRRVLVGRKVLH